MPKIVDIALPVPTNKNFSYLVPDNINSNEILTGRRAVVPFGKRLLTGVIVLEKYESELKHIRYINELLDEEPIFDKNLLKLTKWISEYYLCSHGEVLKSALPQGFTPKSLIKVNLLKEISEELIFSIEKRSPMRAALLKLIKSHNGELSVNYLERELNIKNANYYLEGFEQLDLIKCETIIEKSSQHKYQQAVQINAELLNNNDKLKETLKDLDRTAPKQALLLNRIYANDILTEEPLLVSELVTKNGASARAVVKSLVNKKYIDIIDVEIDRNILNDNDKKLSHRNESELDLTAEQQIALNEIVKSINLLKNKESNASKPFLLFGITGSGKTLVYIHAIEHIIKSGKTALLLVPEISLTPQLIDRFQNAFTDTIAVLHSKMSIGERHDSWQNIRRGKAKIVIGARSAIFAPLKNLGLIIVDEEHESSYKQDSPMPYYNARDTAIMRAKFENAVIVLGSATPSIESMFNAKNDKYNYLSILERADGALLPEIRLIDTIEARKCGNMKGIFTKDLLTEIAKRVERKEGTIIFQNRRGFASLMECYDCGYIPMCKNCSVSLTYHKAIKQWRCHYCGWTEHARNDCPQCGNTELLEIGSGTQRIEIELADYLKEFGVEAKIARMDLDTTSKRGSYRNILHDFSTGNTDILVGTQMVAKGLDIDRVTLVGVVNADLQLFLPDFRASERTFQLLTQVSGRAGRTGLLHGTVIIQTSHPQDLAIQAVKKSDYYSFYNEEIKNRSNANYPPYSRFITIEISSKNEDKVVESSKIIHNILNKNIIRNKIKAIELIGPTVPAIAKLRSDFRRIIILKDIKKLDASARIIHTLLNNSIAEYNSNSGTSLVHIRVDIDSTTR